MKDTYIEDVILEWIKQCESAKNLDVLLDYYKEKYSGIKIIDYSIEGNSIFIQPESSVDHLKITFKIN